jgi:YggT family protein
MAILGKLLYLVYLAIEIYIFIIIASVIVSWLVAFNVLSTSHPATGRLMDVLGRLTDPVMKPVQRFIPPIGGIDISPIVVLIGLILLQNIIIRLFMGAYFV